MRQHRGSSGALCLFAGQQGWPGCGFCVVWLVGCSHVVMGAPASMGSYQRGAAKEPGVGLSYFSQTRGRMRKPACFCASVLLCFCAHDGANAAECSCHKPHWELPLRAWLLLSVMITRKI